MNEIQNGMAATESRPNKYLVHSEIIAEGIVEKPDVVGAVFGQTEGLLGEELNLRELQEKGRIGRIEVEIESQDGKSYGEIKVPTNLDKVETATLAAALETIDKVGPCTAEIRVTEITSTDYIQNKRKEVVERAKELIKTSFKEHEEESEKISELRNMVS